MPLRTDLQESFLPWADELGPAKVVYLHDSRYGLKAIVVVDNVASGPAIGGVRMVPDITAVEVFRLARAMTLKSALAALPHGGGKAGIMADPGAAGREALLRSFARGIAELQEYIPAPDMGTDETAMGVIHREIGRAVGLPRSLGGIPLDEIGATGYGLAECAEVAANSVDLDLKGARVAIEGFGHVGEHAARFLLAKGAVLVAVSDIYGLVYDPEGIDFAALVAAKQQPGTVWNYHRGGKTLAKEKLFSVPSDILIPAARPDSLTRDNAPHIDTRLVVQGANIPATPEAEKILFERGVLVVPDIIANAGGLICCAVEYERGTEEAAFKLIRERIRQNTTTVLHYALEERLLPREAALRLAWERVRKAGAGGDSAFLRWQAGAQPRPDATRVGDGHDRSGNC